MSIVQKDTSGTFVETKIEFDKKGAPINATLSPYTPDADAKTARQMIIRHFTLGNVNMNKPRKEFNDLSVLERGSIDQMSFNTYQPNNGDPTEGDSLGAWRSNAIRPVVRNKAISIAAHSTAQLLFPKIFARDNNNDNQEASAMVMTDLMEFSCDQSDYAKYSLYRTIAALTDPVSIGYTEYSEVYRNVKRQDGLNKKYKIEQILDEDLSGFKDTPVPYNQFFIENVYEPDVQKQAWLIWRRVTSYDLAKTRYGIQYSNFQYVRPGVQCVYQDANNAFYDTYDQNMRMDEVEEIMYWNKNLDIKLIMVNGVLLTDYDNPNPRNDKLYPFDVFGYELINPNFFYYKSLAFKLQHDADIINTLYPMIIDGTYLNVFPAMINTSDTIITGDVIVPGVTTNITGDNPDLKPITTSNNLKAGMDTLMTVTESLEDTAGEGPVTQGQNDQSGSQTAYEISRIEQNAATVLGLFIQMRGFHIKQYGRLRVGDILQYLTIAEVLEIEGQEGAPLAYKTFLLNDKHSSGRNKNRQIKFDPSLPSNALTSEEHLRLSYTVAREQGGLDSKNEICKVNPELFRELKFTTTISPDVLNPMSEDLERAFLLEEYDRAIANPILDQEQVTRDFLLGAYPKSRKDPDKYFAQPTPNAMPQTMLPQAAQGSGANGGGQPLNAIKGIRGSNGLPQQPNAQAALRQ